MKRPTFACNGASVRGHRNVLRLDYQGTDEHRVRLGLPRFVTDLLHLPARYLDLLEIAAYVYAGDRSTLRGKIDAVEYHSWARSMSFHIRVRDEPFWNGNDDLGGLLAKALNWMTGDLQYQFTFSSGHTTPPANLFDAAEVSFPAPDVPPAVMPFSGGLDSLAGALMHLESGSPRVVLVSHQSNSRTKKTQDALAGALLERYPGRVSHYPFLCTLSGARGKEETQRSRSFLYCAIAATIAMVHRSDTIYVFENGVTSLNLARRQDLMNARASRTTHPQTIGRLASFFSSFQGGPFHIKTPFAWKTKAEVIDLVAELAPGLLSSSVSCTAAFKHLGQSTHCGECFQCVDRRLSATAGGHEDLDHAGLYSVDVVQDAFTSPSDRTTAVDYVRQAAFLKKSDVGEFEEVHLKDLAELLDWIDDPDGDLSIVARVHDLLNRHGNQIHHALVRLRQEYEDIFEEVPAGSLLELISTREYLRPDVERMAESVVASLNKALPKMFRKNPPQNEPDLNAKISGLLATHHDDLESEYPVGKFACASVIPDHELADQDLLIEAKYIRGNTSPSKASEGISADLSKYPEEAFILFVVLDLDGAIEDDEIFARDIEEKRPCRVLIVR